MSRVSILAEPGDRGSILLVRREDGGNRQTLLIAKDRTTGAVVEIGVPTGALTTFALDLLAEGKGYCTCGPGEGCETCDPTGA